MNWMSEETLKEVSELDKLSLDYYKMSRADQIALEEDYADIYRSVGPWNITSNPLPEGHPGFYAIFERTAPVPDLTTTFSLMSMALFAMGWTAQRQQKFA